MKSIHYSLMFLVLCHPSSLHAMGCLSSVCGEDNPVSEFALIVRNLTFAQAYLKLNKHHNEQTGGITSQRRKDAVRDFFGSNTSSDHYDEREAYKLYASLDALEQKELIRIDSYSTLFTNDNERQTQEGIIFLVASPAQEPHSFMEKCRNLSLYIHSVLPNRKNSGPLIFRTLEEILMRSEKKRSAL